MNKAREEGIITSITGYRRPYFATQPAYLYPGYRSTLKRAPTQPLVFLPHTLSEVTGPVFGYDDVKPTDSDLTRQHDGEPLGERIVVSGRILDENARPVAHALIELWQANAAGRYRHAVDDHDAPLDPNFTGVGRVLTDGEGRYRFVTIKPGAYPWRNSPNAWRPAHIHLGVFGPGFATRLVTQMYFPGDPLLGYDPIFQSTADADARERLVSRYDPALSEAEWALGYRFDLVMRGRDATPVDPG